MPPRPPSLFPDTTPPGSSITAHCDGGARGNPGPAGYGVEVTDANGRVIAELSEFLGVRTNNYAEYSGLLASLEYALSHGHRSLRVISDSELMVKQIQGKYKVNSPDLKPLWMEARSRIAKLEVFEISHALRHKNKEADRLANEAMDRGMKNQGNKPTEDRGVQPKVVRATPYPTRAETPPPPIVMDPQRSPAAAAGTLPDASGTGKPAAPPSSKSGSPGMLRGFTRDGVIHILGGHTLPSGVFVKIIPE